MTLIQREITRNENDFRALCHFSGKSTLVRGISLIRMMFVESKKAKC